MNDVRNMRKIMEAVDPDTLPSQYELDNHQKSNIGDKSLDTLVQELEQPYDNVYVKLREDYGNEVAERYKKAFNAVWAILEQEVGR